MKKFYQRRMKGGRVIPAALPQGANGYALCRWCSTEVQPPRRTFCSAACVTEHRMRTNTGFLKTLVYRRDKGVCDICNTDTKKIAKQIRNAEPADAQELRKKWGVHKKRRLWKRKWGGGLWDADHIMRVTDGGGLCGLENMRTLCIPCHKKETAKSRKK
jgi:5-methylcytosine-specific restriction enzyme A